MRPRSLLAQVLAVNLLLVAATALIAVIALDARMGELFGGREVFVLGAAVVATLLGNWLLLHRRFAPLDELITAMETADLAVAGQSGPAPRRGDSAEVQRLEGAYERMIARLETERRQAGRAAIEAQEQERRRIAQDLHDEVNQALTAVSLRLQASIEHANEPLASELAETKRLSGQAMQELLSLAGQLRPAVLDDHGLAAALRTQVRDVGEQAGIAAEFELSGDPASLSPEQQLVVYRVAQESLSNAVRHAEARHVRVAVTCGSPSTVRISDDGCGFVAPRAGGLGLSGMRERALLVGGRLRIDSRPGEGTTVELTL